jgi:hypothetical protein
VAGLHVFWVKWNFFGIARRTRADQGSEALIKEEMGTLAEVCDSRVVYHQRCLKLCYVSILAFVSTLLFAIWVIAPLKCR